MMIKFQLQDTKVSYIVLEILVLTLELLLELGYSSMIKLFVLGMELPLVWLLELSMEAQVQMECILLKFMREMENNMLKYLLNYLGENPNLWLKEIPTTNRDMLQWEEVLQVSLVQKPCGNQISQEK